MKRITYSLPKLLAGMVVLLICHSSVVAQNNNSQRRNTTKGATQGTVDTAFVRRQIHSNMMEIRLSELALNKASSQQVRSLAQQMVTDHTQILNDLKKIAGANNMGDMTGAGMDNVKGMIGGDSMKNRGRDTGMNMGDRDTGMNMGGRDTGMNMGGRDTGMGHHMDHTGMHGMAGLHNATGKAFDSLWVSQMLAMHETKVNELTSAAGTITNRELKTVVNRALPKIRQHRDRLRGMDRRNSGDVRDDGM